MILGTLTEIWRYPVKSMGGERVQAAFLKPRGVAGDRCWTVIDSERKEIANAKRWPELLNFRASLCAGDDLVESGYDEEVPDVELESPQGDVFRARDGDAGHRLSTQLKRPVQRSPLARLPGAARRGRSAYPQLHGSLFHACEISGLVWAQRENKTVAYYARRV